MEKINFVDGTTKGNAATFNQLQTNIEKAITAMKTEVLKLAFPIGQPYVTQTDVNPSTILGFGTWERVKGKVLVGLDEDDTDFNTIGKTGGEKTHTLTVDEMPKHNHELTYNNNNSAGTTSYVHATGGFGEQTTDKTLGFNNIGNTGGDEAHNNLQPYRVVGYMWIRTA